jgi:hypothetical protein
MSDNGHAQFTFSTGVVATLRPVSPFIRQAVERAFPPPQPPMVDVDYGDTTQQEPNPNDPDYLKALEEHETEVSIRLRDMMLLHGIDVEIEPKRKQQALELLQSVGLDWPADEPEYLTYIKYCCIGTDDEANRVIMSIRRNREVSEEDVAAATRMFRANVQK